MSVEKRISKKSGRIAHVARVFVARKADGTPIYKCKSFAKKLDAQNYDNNYKNFKSNTFSDKSVSNKTLVSAVWESYVKEISETMKDNSVISYKSRYTKWIEPELGSFQIGNINLVTVSNFKHRIEDRGASPSLTNYCLIVLKSLLEFASSGVHKYIMENPMKYYDITALVKTGSVEKIKYLKRSEAELFFRHAQGTTFYTLMIFIANTGLRIAEAAAIQPSDFDFEAKTITVNHNLSLYSPKRNEPILDKSARVLSTPKSHERRVVSLSPMAIKIAKQAILESQGNYLVFVGAAKEKRTVITKRGPKPTTVQASYLLVRSVWDHVKMISKRANLPNIGPHGLRHTFSANFLMNGGSLHALSKILGHKSITSTEIYAHLSQEFLSSATSIVNFGAADYVESKGNSTEVINYAQSM